MTKKSLAIVFTSLIIGGLFFVGNANAMTYTVSGSSTNIRIPEDRAGTIKRCETCDPVTFNKANCNTDSNCENSDRMLKYNHQYSVSSGYKITFELNNLNTGYLENLYLNNANLIEITSFSPLTTINNLYLDNNREIKLSNNQFNNITIRSLHIDESYLNNFLPDLNNIEKIYLRDNNLETIPAKIRDNRLYYKIYLSNNIRIGNSNTREVYLNNITNGEPDNKIIFIGITTKCNDDSDTNNCSFLNTTSYKFERFGFHYNNSSLTYDYKIYTKDNEDDIKTYENDYGSTTKVINGTPLKPGNYTFKVCLHGDNTHCDTVDFSVDYDVDLEFTHTPESTVYSTDNICFSWDKNGHYPNDYISGYTYSLYPGNLNVATPVDTTYYCIKNSDLPSTPNGDYTFYVSLINTDGDEIDTINYSFTIAINNDITINEPSSSPYSSQGSNKTSVPFDWETESTLFHHYNYYVTTDSYCSNNNKVLSENGITSKHPSFSEDLGNGSYTLCIDMFDSLSNKLGDTAYRSFSVSTDPTLQISSPISGSTVSTATTTFSRNGFVPDPYTLSNYTYTVTGTNYTTGGTTNNTSFSISNLSDGTYTFTITMNYNDGSNKTLTKTATFTINASSGKNLTITSPISGHIYSRDLEKTVSIPFTWIGTGSTLIENFSYILTNTKKNQQITGGTIAKNNSGYYQIPNRELSGGTYKFEVKMLDSDGGSIEEKSHNFSVTIPTYLTIISPIPNNNGVIEQKQNVNFSWSGFSEFDQLYKYKYELKRTKDGTTTTINSGTMNMISKTSTGFIEPSLQNGDYIFTVYMMSGSNEITHATITGKVLDTIDITLSISDGSGSRNNDDSKISISTGNLIFSREGQSEDLSGFYYSITGTNFKNEPFEYTGTLYGSTTGSVTLTGLISGKYRFFVNMLNGNGGSIRSGSLDFEIAIPSSLEIQNPKNGSTVNSSSVNFSRTAKSDILRTGYSTDMREYKYEILQINTSGSTQVLPRQITNANSFNYNFSSDGNYKLNVRLYSGGTVLASNNSTFTISIPKSSGGGGGSSSKSHPTNNLDISIKNKSPDTNEWIEVVVTIDNKYTGKVDFTKMQYYSSDTEKRIDIPITSKNYVSDYSDDAKLGYIKFTSDDRGKKDLPQFIKFLKSGYYRIYVEDKDGFNDYVQFHVGLGHNIPIIIDEEEYDDEEEEVYIARSCKRYTIRYSEALNVYTSPNLNMSEYFMNKDYFKRYVDSKNRYQEGCPKNLGWIATSYIDRTNSDSKYTAPNGKVYFITDRDGDYYSEELNKELKSTPKSFRTITELKNYIRDRNPLISMAKLGPIS